MVDELLVERCLTDIRSNLKELRASHDITWEVYRTNTRMRRYVERTLHILIEGWREPTSARDAFAVLAEQKILRPEEVAIFQNMASFRNLLVHYYERVDDAIMYGIFARHLSDFDLFVERITAYLQRVLAEEDSRDDSINVSKESNHGKSHESIAG